MALTDIERNLAKVERNLLNEVEDVFRGAMAEGEKQAKANAPWTDRTSVARQTIRSYVKKTKNSLIGVLGIGVHYGQYLELSYNGKYRIIRPTLFAISGYLKKKLKQIRLKK